MEGQAVSSVDPTMPLTPVAPNSMDDSLQSGNRSIDSSKTEDPSEAEDSNEADRAKFQYDSVSTITGVRHCSFREFYNVMSDNEPAYSMEVLYGNVSWSQEQEDETQFRSQRKIPGCMEDLPNSVTLRNTSRKTVKRVRFRSAELLSIFSDATGHEWGKKHRTFSTPFKYLIHFHDSFKDQLTHLGSASQGNGSSEQDSAKGLSDLRCYINFAEEHIMPRYHALRQLNPPSDLRVTHDELWYLFRPGDLIYIPIQTLFDRVLPIIKGNRYDSSSRPPKTSEGVSMYQTLWRLVGIRGEKDSDFEIECYFLDYDGETYYANLWDFTIPSFPGEKHVTELEFYPLRCAQHSKHLLDEGAEIGRRFLDCVANSHFAYSGWSITTDPTGIPHHDPEHRYSGQPIMPQYIDGDIIVDFKETFNKHPDFMNEHVSLKGRRTFRSISDAVDDDETLIFWSDPSRSTSVATVTEDLWTCDELDDITSNAYADNDPYTRIKVSLGYKPPVPAADDLVLLPRRVFAFSLNERVFRPLDVRFVKPVHAFPEAFTHLQLPGLHKRLIQAAVEGHLRRHDLDRKLEKEGSAHLCLQDFIRGKGKGLIFLLHGEPGIGKTATAEAVAQWTKRPLFSVPSGALSSRYSGVVSLMDSIFHWAYHWNCILLLDEADVFLSARSPTDLEQNQLVSEFLRKVEYFNGILFLTTNRIGKLDPAISSRMHFILHYKRLNLDSFQEIFRINMERLQATEEQQQQVSGEPALFVVEQDILRFAADHSAKYPKGKGMWNGRQVRNAFLVAASLARFEARQVNNSSFQPQLRYSHFEEVERLTTDFNNFRSHLLGGDDSRKARLNEERDDDYGVVQQDRYADDEQSVAGSNVGYGYVTKSRPFEGRFDGHFGGGPSLSSPAIPAAHLSTGQRQGVPSSSAIADTYGTIGHWSDRVTQQRRYQEPQSAVRQLHNATATSSVTNDMTLAQHDRQVNCAQSSPTTYPSQPIRRQQTSNSFTNMSAVTMGGPQPQLQPQSQPHHQNHHHYEQSHPRTSQVAVQNGNPLTRTSTWDPVPVPVPADHHLEQVDRSEPSYVYRSVGPMQQNAELRGAAGHGGDGGQRE